MYPYDPMTEALPMWARAIAAILMVTLAWFTSVRIDREPLPDQPESAPQATDWQWPPR